MICGRFVRRRRGERGARRAAGVRPPERGAQHVARGAEDLNLVDLRGPEPAVLEDDRDLEDREAGVVHTPDHLLEERIARRAHVERVDRLEHGTAVAAKARGAVVHGNAQQPARVEVGEARQRAAAERPVGDPSAGDITGSDHHVVLSGDFEHVRQVARVMAVVAVHREHAVVAVLEPVAEAGEVGGAESQLARAAQEMQARLVAAGRLHEIARTVRAVVVYHQHVELRVLREHVGTERKHVLRLVVGGQDDQRAHGSRARYHQWIARRRAARRPTKLGRRAASRRQRRPSVDRAKAGSRARAISECEGPARWGGHARSRTVGSRARPGARRETALRAAAARRVRGRAGAAR